MAGQGPLHILDRELAEATLDHGAPGPFRVRTLWVQGQPTVAEVDPDQDLVGLELGWLHGQPHAIVEAQEDGVDVRDVPALGHPGGGAEGLIGPGLQRLGLGGPDLGLQRLPGGCDDHRLAALDRLGAGHEDKGPGSAEQGGGGPVQTCGVEGLGFALEPVEVLFGAGHHDARRNRSDDGPGEGRGGPGARPCAGRCQGRSCVGDHPLELVLPDPEPLDPALFLKDGGQGLPPVAAAGEGVDPGGLLDPVGLTERGAGRQEGRLSAPRQVG